MASRKAKLNVSLSLVTNAANILISFFAQKIFLKILNAEYLGLNGLFSNIISMLAIFELGVGSAITFSLYKPLTNNDREAIKALMNFYRKAYNIIAILVAIVGVTITPFLPFLIKEVTLDVNIYIIYLMFVADVIGSYILTYRSSILYADQKNYIVNGLHVVALLAMNIAQLSVLALTKNYYLYLGIKIITRIVENLTIHVIVHRQYPYLDKVKYSKLEKAVSEDIFKKIKALLFHKIGTFIVLGTDNLIISKFIGLIQVGLYSNYYLVINAAKTLIGQAITALTPTVGHKLATEKSENAFNAFRKTRFAGFILASVASSGFCCCIQPLIAVWVGAEYQFETLAVAVLALNLFQKIQRSAYSTFKEAAGIYHEDRFVPLAESILNIIASIALLHFFGVAGVFMGTIISGLALWCYSYPKLVYKRLFNRSYFSYAKETAGFIAIFVIVTLISAKLSTLLVIENYIMQIVANGIIVIVVNAVAISLAYFRDYSYKYLIKALFKMVRRRR